MARCPVDTHTFTLVTDIDNIDFNLTLDNIDLDRSLARLISTIPDELAITTHSNDHLILPRGSNLTSVSILTQSQQFDGINPLELHWTSACCHTRHYQVPDITN
ncbi:hypothetical protein PILCRDRAFT_16119 [Piloderma croceum F 1598]|uniref:Uncharacterized protein n=1 Tax=Piloderma croceum (strain F 1598) TaxID=765440 RepID=A0A0C3AF65_PILCF|nr:hypothetical protein PILCRDRAFT_16119 [Piloderma croceum F 1598]